MYIPNTYKLLNENGQIDPNVPVLNEKKTRRLPRFFRCAPMIKYLKTDKNCITTGFKSSSSVKIC